MATRLGDYIEFRKDQIEKTIKELNEKKKCEDDYSVQKCIDIVDAIEELTDEQKVDCNELFQSEMNGQIFVGTKNQKVRLFWLKKKISQVYLTC
jgi:Mg/Co/Ni transporter MgtE